MYNAGSARFSIAPWQALVSVCRHTGLLKQLVRRDVASRYRGSALGVLWSFLVPLLLLAVYTFVFSFVFNARFGAEGGGGLDFALNLFAGLILHTFFSEILVRAPVAMPQYASFVKKLVFPLDLFAWVLVGSALCHLVTSLVILAVALSLAHGALPATALLVPLAIAPFALMALGVAWVLLSLGVYFRDIAQVASLASMLLLFLGPVFYPVSALPEAVQPFIYLNPLSVPVEYVRAFIVEGRVPPLAPLAVYTAAAAGVAAVGFAWFQKTRRGFADVL